MENAISEAVSAIESGDKKRAHSLLLGVIQEDPNNVLAWLWMAEVYADPKNKKDCYLRALQIDPENEVALAHMKAIKYQEALEKIESEYQDAGKAEADTDEKLSQERQKKSKKKTSPVIALMLVLALALSLAVAYIVLDKRGTFDKWGAKDSEETLLVNQDATSTSPSLGIIAPESTQQSEVSTPESLEKEPETQEPSVDVVEDTPTPTQTATAEPIIIEPTMPAPNPKNMVVNGYFLEQLDGWRQIHITEGGQSSRKIVESENSDYKKALRMEQEGEGTLGISQMVPVSSINLNLYFTMQIYSGTYSSENAGLIIVYYDNQGNRLGWTRVSEKLKSDNGSALVGNPKSMANTATINNYRVESEKVYKRYKLNLLEEVENNLLGIEPNNIASIELIVFVSGTYSLSSSWVEISEIELLAP